jgi:hypothetical protein
MADAEPAELWAENKRLKNVDETWAAEWEPDRDRPNACRCGLSQDLEDRRAAMAGPSLLLTGSTWSWTSASSSACATSQPSSTWPDAA